MNTPQGVIRRNEITSNPPLCSDFGLMESHVQGLTRSRHVFHILDTAKPRKTKNRMREKKKKKKIVAVAKPTKENNGREKKTGIF